MTRRKRILSTLLTICMLLSLLPGVTLPARAANEHSGHSGYNQVTTTLPTSSGSYYLTQDITISDPWKVTNATITLCLNGYKITYQNSSATNKVAIDVNSHGKLTICDCSNKVRYGYWSGTNYSIADAAPTSGVSYDTLIGGIITGNGTGVAVNSGTFTMTGGNIAGNSSAFGSGVSMTSGEFNLNGGTISGNLVNTTSVGYGSGVSVKGGTFNMTDGAICNNRIVSSNTYSRGGGVCVENSGGTFTMSGGEISGNTVDSGKGGGVCANSGTFTFSGGTIKDNTAANGGGVAVTGYSGSFTMEGNTEITDNYATNGGGVYMDKGSFTLKAGSITKNIASTKAGGIYVTTEGGKITMPGGLVNVTGNTLNATSKSNLYLPDGKNTYITISGDLADASSIGVTIPDFADDNNKAAKIDGTGVDYEANAAKFFHDASNYVGVADSGFIYLRTPPAPSHTHPICGASCACGKNHEDQEWTAWKETGSLPAAAGSYYLETDVTLSTTWAAPTGDTSLCLNGHDIKQSGSNKSVITVGSGAILTICDCSDRTRYGSWSGDTYKIETTASSSATEYDTITGGILTGGRAIGSYSGGGVFVAGGGTFNLYGGAICGNSAASYGGGVGVDGSLSQFNLYGGAVCGNRTEGTTNGSGGGIYLSSGKLFLHDGAIRSNKSYYGGGVGGTNYMAFTMADGAISGNSAAKHGGGVYVSGGTNYTAAFTMSGGEISGNSAAGDNGGWGGGVYAGGKEFTLSGGEITNNSAYTGGGVYLMYGSFTLTGGAITGNNASTAIGDGGGGVYVTNTSSGIKVSGGPKVTGNTQGSATKNVCLTSNASATNIYITITGALADGAKIGITWPNNKKDIPVAKWTGTDSVSAADAAKFVRDSDGLTGTAEGQNVYLRAHVHSWEYTADGETITAQCTASGCTNSDGGSVTIVPPTNPTYDGNAKAATISGSFTTGANVGEISYKQGDTTLTSAPINAGTYTASITVEGKTASVTYTIAKAAAQTAAVTPTLEATYNSITVTDPVIGQKYLCLKSSEPEPTAGSGDWRGCADGKLKFTGLERNTAYKVYTYTPAADENHNDSDVVSVSKTTAKEKITSVTAPGNVTLTEYYTTAEEVKAKLSKTVNIATESGSPTALNITWTSPESYNADPSAENTFNWAVSVPEGYTFESGVQDKGSITVTNKAATAVTITPQPKTITYSEYTYDVSELFTIPTEAGTASYTIVTAESTGAGTLNGASLTITKAGTIKIAVKTAENGNYAAGSATATLTVDKATVAVPEKPASKEYTGSAQTSGMQETTNYTVSEGTDQINAGDYTITLTLTTPDLYKWADSEETTCTLTFTITKAQVTKPSADATEYTYTGAEQTYKITENSAYSVSGSKRTVAGSQEVTVSLKDKNNYEWSDSTIADVTFTFTIKKAKYDAPASGEGYTIDYAAETITVTDGYEVYTAGTDGTKVPSGSISNHLGKTLYICKAGDTNHDPSARTPITIAGRPAAPTGVTKTDETVKDKADGAVTSITADMEYKIGDDQWKPGPVSLTNLAANTIVTVRVKAAATAPYGVEQTYTIAASDVTLTVTFDANGHGAAPEQISNLSYNETITAPNAPTATGYTFGGWYTEEACTTAYTFGTPVTDNTTLYAKWTANTYAVQFNANGGTGDMADQSFTYDVTQTLAKNSFAREKYTFAGWAMTADGAAVYADGQSVKNLTATDGAAITLYAKWSEVPTYSVSGTVQDSSNTELSDVTVALKQGNKTLSTTQTDAQGAYSFPGVLPGVYNVVATTDDKTMTILVTVTSSNEENKNLIMPAGNVNSVLEVKENTPAVVVGGLEQEAETVKNEEENNSATSITVTMTVEQKADVTASSEVDDADTKAVQTAIKQQASGKTLTYLEIKVEKTVDDQTESITQTSKVLEIVIPFAFTGRRNVTVYRHHGDKTEALQENDTKTEGTFRRDEQNGLIYVYAQKFSTYAIGYETVPRGGGGLSTVALTFETNGGSALAKLTRPYGATVDLSDCTSTRAGYRFTGWYADKVLTERITSIKLDGSKTVYAGWAKASGYLDCLRNETCPAHPFTDVDLSAWYHDGVHYCVENGLMVGVAKDLFAPDVTTSRAMIATILWRQAGSPVVNYAMRFEDVDASAWYGEAVRWAASEGVVTGYGNGKFGPNDPITREQLAAMLWRHTGKPGPSGSLTDFTDAEKVCGWAADAMAWAVEQGIVTGKGGGILDPLGQATRAEAAAMLQRYLENGLK